jgi:hypothetical protein
MIENKCPDLRSRNSGSVLGFYKVPDTHAYLDKPHPFTISKSKDRAYLDKMINEKKKIPGPASYNLPLNLMGKKKVSIYKVDRTSFCDEISKKSKEVPGVGLYSTLTREKIKGIFKRYFNIL